MSSNPRARSIGASILVPVLLACGCDYPLYGFVPDDSASPSDSTPEGAADAHPTDTASTDAEDAGDTTAADAPVDTTSTDAGIDTSSGDTPADVLVTKGCAGTVHLFCDDFDTVTTPESGWTDINVVGGGENLLDKALFASPGASYLAMLPASALDEASASLNEDFSLASPSLALRATMLVRLAAGTSAQEATLLKLSRVGSGNGVEVAIGPTGLVMNIVGTSSSGSFPMLTPKAGVWFNLQLDVVLATSSTGSAKASIDDVAVVTRTGITTATSSSASARMVVGVYQFSTPIAAVRANFDDVTFDTL